MNRAPQAVDLLSKRSLGWEKQVSRTVPPAGPELDPDTAWLVSAPLPFGQRQARLITDLDQFIDALSLSVHLSDFDALGARGRFRHRATTAIVGDIAVTSCAHTPITGSTLETSEALITINTQGQLTYSLEGRTWCARPDQAIYLPGAAVRGEGSGAGVVFNIDPARLARELCFHSRERWSVERARRFLQNPQLINLADPAVLLAWRAMVQALQFLDLEVAGVGPRVMQQSLGAWVEEQIYRCVAQMLRPQPPDRARSPLHP
jgi:hypothetical protein